MDDNYIEPQENSKIDTPTDPTPVDNSLPIETIKLNPTYDDILEQHKHINKGALILMYAIFFLLLAWDVYSTIRYGLSETVTSYIISIVILLFIFMLNSGVKTNAKKQYEKAKNGTSSLLFFTDRIEYSYNVGDELHSFFRIDPKAITGAKVLKRSVAFLHDGMCFIIPKADVSENNKALEMIFASSPDAEGINNISEIIDGKKTKKSKRITSSVVLNTLSVLAVIALVFLTDIIYGPLWWLPVVCLALPIVALCLIKGLSFKGKKGAITISVITIIAFGIIGLSTMGHVFLGDPVEDVEEELTKISEAVGIDIPEIYDGYIYEESIYNEDTKTYFSYTNVYAWFDDAANENFKKDVEQSGLWISSLDNETADFFDEVFDPDYSDAFIIYNCTEKTYNQLPTTNESCEYIIIVYEYKNAFIDIYTFSKAYAGQVGLPDDLSA